MRRLRVRRLLQRHDVRSADERDQLVLRRGRGDVRGLRRGAGVQQDDRSVRVRRDVVPQWLLHRVRRGQLHRVRERVEHAVRCGRRAVRELRERPLLQGKRDVHVQLHHVPDGLLQWRRNGDLRGVRRDVGQLVRRGRRDLRDVRRRVLLDELRRRVRHRAQQRIRRVLLRLRRGGDVQHHAGDRGGQLLFGASGDRLPEQSRVWRGVDSPVRRLQDRGQFLHRHVHVLGLRNGKLHHRHPHARPGLPVDRDGDRRRVLLPRHCGKQLELTAVVGAEGGGQVPDAARRRARPPPSDHPVTLPEDHSLIGRGSRPPSRPSQPAIDRPPTWLQAHVQLRDRPLSPWLARSLEDEGSLSRDTRRVSRWFRPGASDRPVELCFRAVSAVAAARPRAAPRPTLVSYLPSWTAPSNTA